MKNKPDKRTRNPRDNAADEIVAANIRAGLAYLRATQADLAEYLDLSEMAVSRRINATTPVTPTEMFAIAEFLQMRPADLLEAKSHLQVTNRLPPNVTPISTKRSKKDPWAFLLGDPNKLATVSTLTR
jgi:transcriptional regulator with XRE-family HTH domain